MLSRLELRFGRMSALMGREAGMLGDPGGELAMAPVVRVVVIVARLRGAVAG